MLDGSRPVVLRLIARLNIGGPARQALLLTKRLRDTHPTILASGTAPEHEGELSDPEVEVQRVPLVRQIRPWTDARALREIHGLIGRLSPSIVHTHTAKAGTIGRLAAIRSPRRPIIVHTFHGHVLESYFSPPVQNVFLRIERWLAARTDALVAVSHEVRDSLLGMGIGSSERFFVIPLGFELDPFLAVSAPTGTLRRRLHLDNETPLVAIVGRLAAIKDHTTMLQAIARLDGVHLAIAGDGELKDDLVRSTGALGIADRVHFLGWQRDMPTLLSDVDVVGLSSLNEGTPVSLIEAGACGKASVATDVGGTRSVIEDGVTGLLRPASDPEALAAALSRLLSDRELADKMGEAARARIRRRFTAQRLVDDVRALYDGLLSSRMD